MSVMYEQCARYCVALVRAVMQGMAAPELPDGVELKEIYDFAKLHGVETMVFRGLEGTNIDKSTPLWREWENRVDLLMTQSVVQLAERDILFAALPEAGVSLLPVKGCWLKEQYPELDYRQMSDLDMLIHPEDAGKAKTVMLQLGYTPEEDETDNHDSYRKPPYMGVELHTALLQEDDTCRDYYDTVWDRAAAVEGCPGVFRLKPEDEYIYYLLHLYKHLSHAGMGIRSFLDSLVYRKRYPDMDRAYLKAEYERLGLRSFAESVEILSDCWFDRGEPVSREMAAMERSILAAGSFGTENRRLQNEMRQLQGRFRSPVMLKLAWLFSCLFLPLKAMAQLYPVLNRIPILLPVFWVWRPISRLFFNPKALTRLIKQTNEEGDKLWSEFNWQDFRSN